MPGSAAVLIKIAGLALSDDRTSLGCNRSPRPVAAETLAIPVALAPGVGSAGCPDDHNRKCKEQMK